MNKQWTDEFLDSMRQQTDPEADNVIQQVVAAGGFDDFNRLLRHMVDNRSEIPDSLPPVIKEYFEKTQALPAWADLKKISLGEAVFVLHGPEMITMLLLASLPTSYTMAKGAPVLKISAQLTKHFHRRIFRTAQFIADVMQTGGLSASGRGIRSAQKIRLIHASIRYAIKHRPDWQKLWNSENGEPINQEDMATTLLDFSVSVLKGIEKTGIRLSVEEAEAYHHCWRVVGHILGLDPRLQAESVDDAYELSRRIAARQAGESEAGQELARDLIGFVQDHLPRWMNGFAATAIRYFCGDDVAKILGLAPANWTFGILYLQMSLMKRFDTYRRRHPGAQKYIRFLTWQLMQRIVLHEEGETFYFELPDELRAAWKLPNSRNIRSA